MIGRRVSEDVAINVQVRLRNVFSIQLYQFVHPSPSVAYLVSSSGPEHDLILGPDLTWSWDSI